MPEKDILVDELPVRENIRYFHTIAVDSGKGERPVSMSIDNPYEPQILALASEALRITRTYNATLFAIPDSNSEWGFTPESFLSSADWMFNEQGVRKSGISKQAFELTEQIRNSQRLYGVNLKALSRAYMTGQSDKVVLFEIMKQFYAQTPELEAFVETEARSLGYGDFYPENVNS